MEKEKALRVEISHKIPERGWFYSCLDLPATCDEIEDALHRARVIGEESGHVEFEIVSSKVWPELMFYRMDMARLDELNYLADRLLGLDSIEGIVIRAVASVALEKQAAAGRLSIKDLINCTFGLGEVITVADVGNDEQLGRLVIESEMNEEVNAVPEHLLYLLDEKKIGEIQRKADSGVYVGDIYVAAGGYELLEVYDGETLPGHWVAESSLSVFELELCLKHNQQEENSVKRISLPAKESEIRSFMNSLEHGTQEEVECLKFASSIPQITKKQFSGINEINLWSRLAEKIRTASQQEKVLFKAVLSAEKPKDIIGIWDIMMNLNQYELLYEADGIDEFFKQYLAHFLDDSMDRRWVNALMTSPSKPNLLLRLGAANTDYGVVSGRGRSLFEPVSYSDNNEETQKTSEEELQGNKQEQKSISGMSLVM